MVTLRIRSVPEVPLETEAITPDKLLGKTEAETALLPVAIGNRQACLGDFFAISGSGDGEIHVEGDLRRVKLIGAGMTQGQINVHGDAGMHLGAGMTGGRIVVHGNAADWAGAEMCGGEIWIHGDAGHGLGAGYRGSARGMNRGTIIVDGRAGDEVGSAMRRGLIVIGGDSGDFTGSFMIAGTIVVLGRPGQRPGAGLKRGSIITYHEPVLLPTYRYACTYSSGYVDLLLRHLAGLGVMISAERFGGRYRRYSGDLAALGKGEILVWEGA